MKITPADVGRRLIEVFGLIKAIAEASELKMLSLRIDTSDAERMKGITPGDVYGIATLADSELAYFDSNAKPVPSGSVALANCPPGTVCKA